MRVVTYILLALLLLLQYPLWLGKGSWLKVWEMGKQVEAQKQINDQTQKRNASLDAEVRDLKRGTDAIEERARSELGMVKQGEVFFRWSVEKGLQRPRAWQPPFLPHSTLSDHRRLFPPRAGLQFRDMQRNPDQVLQGLLSIQMVARDGGFECFR